jgi:23S rRNA pseudouridine1911/1915/1917 synthase
MAHLEVAHENKDYIVINKMAGLISEKNPYENTTVEDQVFAHLSKTDSDPFIGVIHRLDRVTSGVLIFAKKKNILVSFNELFSSRKVQKTYLAVVKNKPLKDKETLTHFLVKNNLEKRADIVPAKSKHAQECILSYEVVGKNDHGYLLELKPSTGRFHQIRAQLSHIGLPIIGDEKYGSDTSYLPLSVCLHAWKLAYTVPHTKKTITFEATVPENGFWDFPSTKSNS